MSDVNLKTFLSAIEVLDRQALPLGPRVYWDGDGACLACTCGVPACRHLSNKCCNEQGESA